MPATGWGLESDGRLHLQNAPVIAYPKALNYRDFFVSFHLKLTDAGGAAWAVRVRDVGNYYLFYLSRPEGMSTTRMNVYIVKDGKFDPKNHLHSVAAPVQLRADGEYDVEITAIEGVIESEITPTDGGVGVKLISFRDPDDTFPTGSIGFRTVGPEKFSIDDLNVLPPEARQLR